jgi:predicted membrane-bound mannosyltransferase
VPNSGGARASEVVEALLGAQDASARLVRTFMGAGEHSPLALQALRERATAQAVQAEAAEAIEAAASEE